MVLAIVLNSVEGVVISFMPFTDSTKPFGNLKQGNDLVVNHICNDNEIQFEFFSVCFKLIS